MKKISSLLAVSATIFVSACGGGGDNGNISGSNNQITPPKCSNGAVDYPTCTPPIIPATFQSPLPSAYTLNSDEYNAFTELNKFRRDLGLGPVNHDPKIDLATKNHANYLALSWIPGESGHNEVAGRNGFTGVNHVERMKFVGITNVFYGGEVMTADSGNDAIIGLVNVVFHRGAFMDEYVTDVGMTSSFTTGTIINFSYPKNEPQKNASNFIGVYPYDQQPNVLLTHGMEEPNPFAREMEMTVENMCKKTSSPVSIQSQASTTLITSTFTIKEFGSDILLPVRIIDSNTSNHIRPNQKFLVGTRPFKPFTTYTVQFVGKVVDGLAGTGFAVNKTWSFTSGSGNQTAELKCASLGFN